MKIWVHTPARSDVKRLICWRVIGAAPVFTIQLSGVRTAEDDALPHPAGVAARRRPTGAFRRVWPACWRIFSLNVFVTSVPDWGLIRRGLQGQ